MHHRLYELTWKSQVGFIYDATTLTRLSTFPYSGEGWGLTHNARSLIMSDGTSVLRFLDPTTLVVQRDIAVRADGESVEGLNELEWVNGEIWANIWRTPQIARIDPASGRVVGWVDLDPAIPVPNDPDGVANGIAYDSVSHRLFVTGKHWPTLYEIRLTPPA
jgi:glutaminyl-peptide cyclotransferase